MKSLAVALFLLFAADLVYGDDLDPLFVKATQGLTQTLTKPAGPGKTLIYFGTLGPSHNTSALLRNGKLMTMTYFVPNQNYLQVQRDVVRLLLMNDSGWANTAEKGSFAIPGSATRATWDGSYLTIYIDPVHYQTTEEAKAKEEREKEEQFYSHQVIISATVFQIVNDSPTGVLAREKQPYLNQGNYMPWGAVGVTLGPGGDVTTADEGPFIFIENYPRDGLHPDMAISAQVVFSGEYSYTTLRGDRQTVWKYTVVPQDHLKQAQQPADPNAQLNKRSYSMDDLVGPTPKLP